MVIRLVLHEAGVIGKGTRDTSPNASTISLRRGAVQYRAIAKLVTRFTFETEASPIFGTNPKLSCAVAEVRESPNIATAHSVTSNVFFTFSFLLSTLIARKSAHFTHNKLIKLTVPRSHILLYPDYQPPYPKKDFW
jgi:hypothetical protein